MNINSNNEIPAGMHVTIIPSMGRALLKTYFEKNNIDYTFRSTHALSEGEYPACVFMGKKYDVEHIYGVISPLDQEEILKLLEDLRKK